MLNPPSPTVATALAARVSVVMIDPPALDIMFPTVLDVTAWGGRTTVWLMVEGTGTPVICVTVDACCAALMQAVN